MSRGSAKKKIRKRKKIVFDYKAPNSDLHPIALHLMTTKGLKLRLTKDDEDFYNKPDLSAREQKAGGSQDARLSHYPLSR